MAQNETPKKALVLAGSVYAEIKNKKGVIALDND